MYVTNEFDIHAADGSQRQDFNPLLRPEYRSMKYYPIENREAWDQGMIPEGSEIVDVACKGGRLALFDSVSLPHEVQQVKSGVRVALAGWFHEKSQNLLS